MEDFKYTPRTGLPGETKKDLPIPFGGIKMLIMLAFGALVFRFIYKPWWPWWWGVPVGILTAWAAMNIIWGILLGTSAYAWLKEYYDRNIIGHYATFYLKDSGEIYVRMSRARALKHSIRQGVAIPVGGWFAKSKIVGIAGGNLYRTWKVTRYRGFHRVKLASPGVGSVWISTHLLLQFLKDQPHPIYDGGCLADRIADVVRINQNGMLQKAYGTIYWAIWEIHNTRRYVRSKDADRIKSELMRRLASQLPEDDFRIQELDRLIKREDTVATN
jgi:hypothetical protein